MATSPHPVISDVLARVEARSKATRAAYLRRIADVPPSALSCGNLAHACAACEGDEKAILLGGQAPNIGIITAHNDMLSAHEPFVEFPALIKKAAKAAGATAQVAGGVPAMCDGVTQGQVGMELSLFSRDVIAMASAVALSHNTFSAAMFLGVCDKIVPGMMIAAACFGHLPTLFAPAGPMPSGLSNAEKARVRELYAAGKADRQALLEAETASYHSPGTCTFYGTANTNQAMLEIMGLMLPGAAFVNPRTPLREALTQHATRQLCSNAKQHRATAAEVLSPAAFINAMVGVLATGGSTNHTMHIPAIARAAGVQLQWDDFADLSRVVPLLCRLYPNGAADVNHFHAAGGMSFLIGELLSAGLLINDVKTVVGDGLDAYTQEPKLHEENGLQWGEGCRSSLDDNVLRPASAPFAASGGLKVISGNLGRAIVKVSALPQGLTGIKAPARIFESQNDLMRAFDNGELHGKDVFCVVRFQGARANGMPELHKLMPLLSVLQDAGQQVGLLTDGRMSGASGKVPAAIHLTPEAAAGGALAKLQDGDMISLDLAADSLNILIDEKEWQQRTPHTPDLSANAAGCGRELFGGMRRFADEYGGGAFFANNPQSPQ